jgi:hypothetical protein
MTVVFHPVSTSYDIVINLMLFPHQIQKVVISGGEFKQVDFKPREIVSLLLDDEGMLTLLN